MSKAQLTAFMVKVDADAALKARVDAAASVDAVVAIALEHGHVFSPVQGAITSTLSRAGPSRRVKRSSWR